MKSAKGSLPRALDAPAASVRFYLFHGADEGQSRAHGERLLRALGGTRQLIAGATLKSDPAALADASGAISLFGDRQIPWIEPATDDAAPAVEALLASDAPGEPVIAVAGTLRKTSALLKLAEAHPLALAHVSYVPDGRFAAEMIAELARAEGLRVDRDAAVAIAEACGNDRRVALQELAKFALYLDAAPDRPRALDREALDAVGAGLGGNFLRIADLALAGRSSELAQELALLPAGGGEAIPVLRSVQRRLLMLAPLRARVEAGERVDDVMASAGKSLFWKDKDVIGPMLRTWDAAGLARIAERTGAAERAMILEAVPQTEVLGELLLRIAREAARRA
jgi:DNA polymerase III subunit delta